jgi:probable rRNA maturation factor
MIHLQIDPVFSNLPVDALQRAAEAALQHVTGATDGDLSLVLTDDAQLHDLNRRFRQIDAPTDVLSFPDGETDPDTGQPYLGDVILSVARAEAQAAAAGHTLTDELQLLTIHGVLHLLGHDHAEEDEKAAMWAAQEQILAAIGCNAHLPA